MSGKRRPQQKTIITVSFEVDPHEFPAAADLFTADRLGPTVQAMGGSALSVGLTGPRRELDFRRLPSLDEKLYFCGVPMAAAIGLETRGVGNIGDALTAGKNLMKGASDCGPKTVNALDKSIRSTYPGLALLEEPSPAYIATFRTSLSEVSFVALGPYDLTIGPTLSVQNVLDWDHVVTRHFSEITRADLQIAAREFAEMFTAARADIG